MELFKRCKTWLNLETTTQFVTNAIWALWISPVQFVRADASRLDTSKEDTDKNKNNDDHDDEDDDDDADDAEKDRSIAGYDWRPLTRCSEAVLAMLQEKSSEHDSHREGGMENSETDASSCLSKLDVLPSCKFVAYTLQVLCHVCEWDALVQMAETLHRVSHGMYGEEILPLAIHGQQQRWTAQARLVQQQQARIDAFVQAYEDQKKKHSRRKARLVLEQGRSTSRVLSHGTSCYLD